MLPTGMVDGVTTNPTLIAKSGRIIAEVIAEICALVEGPISAEAVDRNFAGSAQFDYHFVPGSPDVSARSVVLDGMTVEAAFKLAIDISDHLSANVKLCYGCHGFETDMAYFDYRVVDELNFRLGRFSPSFGAFNILHDPANHRLSDKPLPYDMGRMLRMNDWNMGVLPSPFPDNGLEINGVHWFGRAVQLDYAAYVVSGFKADATSPDLDFLQSRSGNLYYVDNNARPSYGGRVAATVRVGDHSDATLGASAMTGAYDPDGELDYLILGGDLSMRLDETTVRLEYLVRRQQFSVEDETRFKYEIPEEGGDFFVKHGAFVEVVQPVSPIIDLIGRADGMVRVGNVLAASPLLAESSVFRYTLGTAIAVERGLRVKVSSELWSFSDEGANDKHTEVSFHVGGVGTF